VNPLHIAIAGCTGRMGRTLMQFAAADPAFQVVAATTVPQDPRIGQDAGPMAGLDPLGVLVATDVTAACDALIEFTLPAGCQHWAQWCAEHGVPLVSGTTGLDAAQQATLRQAAEKVPVVWAPNMSVGINLLLGLVAELAAKLEESWDIEICETHHRQKVDAPSGTARALLDAACAGRNRAAAEVGAYGRSGECGPRPRGQIGVHALRMGAIVGEHEVHFTSASESLTLRHRAFSRDTFAAGALRAARWLQQRPPGLYTMRDVLCA
jgi:4-hydroxy-tetrahydrodipicolinate reductase